MVTLDLTQFPRGAIGGEKEEGREETEMEGKASAERRYARNREACRAAMARRTEEGDEVGKDSPPRYL